MDIRQPFRQRAAPYQAEPEYHVFHRGIIDLLLSDETAPLPFVAGAVGVKLFGKAQIEYSGYRALFFGGRLHPKLLKRHPGIWRLLPGSGARSAV